MEVNCIASVAIWVSDVLTFAARVPSSLRHTLLGRSVVGEALLLTGDEQLLRLSTETADAD